MKTPRVPFSFLVTGVLALAVHLDWHAGRPAHGPLSYDWSLHWLLAIPLFAWAAWHIVRRWPREKVLLTSVMSLSAAVLVGHVLEALLEYFLDHWPLTESFGSVRMEILCAFLVAGIVTYTVTAWLLIRVGAGNRSLGH